MSNTSDPGVEARAVEYVRLHPGCIQSNVIEHVMRGRSYGYAQRRIHRAIDAGLIVARREGSRLYLYPPGAGERGDDR